MYSRGGRIPRINGNDASTPDEPQGGRGGDGPGRADHAVRRHQPEKQAGQDGDLDASQDADGAGPAGCGKGLRQDIAGGAQITARTIQRKTATAATNSAPKHNPSRIGATTISTAPTAAIANRPSRAARPAERDRLLGLVAGRFREQHQRDRRPQFVERPRHVDGDDVKADGGGAQEIDDDQPIEEAAQHIDGVNAGRPRTVLQQLPHRAGTAAQPGMAVAIDPPHRPGQEHAVGQYVRGGGGDRRVVAGEEEKQQARQRQRRRQARGWQGRS